MSLLRTTTLVCLCALATLVPAPGVQTLTAPDTDWPVYGGDLAATKSSPLDQIDRTNFERLEIAWRWRSPDAEVAAANPGIREHIYEATPVAVDGTLYVSTAFSQVAAIEATTGRTRWVYDPGTYRQGQPPNLGFVTRGVAYWDGEPRPRIFFATGDARLLALHADTGAPVAEFGSRGAVDLTQGLGRPVDRRLYGVTSPPLVAAGLVIVGSSIRDETSADGPLPPGDVRAFDALSGELVWTFHSIPKPGRQGHESWRNDAWKTAGGINVWTLMSADLEAGLLYLPFGTVGNDLWGGDRPGDNLFSESLVCVELATGRYRWHYQTVRHGLWDYDLPAAPNLIDVESRRLVAQVTKQGFVFVFDRITGEPLWEIEQRPVPSSPVDGEQAAETQPFPSRPPAFERQGLGPDDLIAFTPELRQEAATLLQPYRAGPLYTPPSTRPTVSLPGQNGGANWSGAAADPRSGRLFVPSITAPYLMTLEPVGAGEFASGPRYGTESGFRTDMQAPLLLPGPRGLPITKPPYSRVTAIDLTSGAHAWQVPLGEGPRHHPDLRSMGLGRLGSGGRGPALLTPDLLIVAEGLSTEKVVARLRNQPEPRCNPSQLRGDGWWDWFFSWFDDDSDLCGNRPLLHAFDKDNGNLLGAVELPAFPGGAPMTYSAEGRQYIVVAVGGLGDPSELVALALPDP